MTPQSLAPDQSTHPTLKVFFASWRSSLRLGVKRLRYLSKTFTTISSIHRLIKFADARRVLFLVDRGNLVRQTMKAFQQYATPDDGRKFTELYNVQYLKSNRLDPVSRVCITTIQRLYSMLRGDADLDPTLEEGSQFDTGAGLITEPAPVVSDHKKSAILNHAGSASTGVLLPV